MPDAGFANLNHATFAGGRGTDSALASPAAITNGATGLGNPSAGAAPRVIAGVSVAPRSRVAAPGTAGP